jgi:hypothetical protein
MCRDDKFNSSDARERPLEKAIRISSFPICRSEPWASQQPSITENLSECSVSGAPFATTTGSSGSEPRDEDGESETPLDSRFLGAKTAGGGKSITSKVRKTVDLPPSGVE